MLLRAQRATPTEQAEPERRDDDEMCVSGHMSQHRVCQPNLKRKQSSSNVVVVSVIFSPKLSDRPLTFFRKNTADIHQR